jgi:hypothetical protein
MTSASELPAASSWRLRLQHLIPADVRETGYRVVTGALTFLTGYGYLDNDQALLWGQVGLGTLTALFALLYTTDGLRQVLYVVTGPLGGLLMAYGIVSDVKWAVLVASIGQVFGIATAAAKTIGIDQGEHPIVVTQRTAEKNPPVLLVQARKAQPEHPARHRKPEPPAPPGNETS